MKVNESNKIQTQIGNKSIEMWFDTETRVWKLCVKEWRDDYWALLVSAECTVEKVIRSFYAREIKDLKSTRLGKELEESEEKTL